MSKHHWFDDAKSVPLIDEQVQRLDHFVDAMRDGVIERS